LTGYTGFAQKIKFVISRYLRLAGDAEKPCVFFLDSAAVSARRPLTKNSWAKLGYTAQPTKNFPRILTFALHSPPTSAIKRAGRASAETLTRP
jgi:hypothetical protein